MIGNNKAFFKDLINEAKKILKRSNWDGKQYKNNSSSPSSEEYSSLIYRGMDIILKSFNKDSQYYKGLDNIVSDENKSVDPYYYAYCFGIIEGAYKAYLKFIPERSASPEEARSHMKGKIELLKKASEHIHYEINKIFEMYKFFKEKKDDFGPDGQIKIENFLLHSRNLLEFFYPNKTIFKDTMCVYDFLDNFKEFDNKKATEEELELDKVKDDINKFLSHITYSRCEIDFKNHQITNIMKGIFKTIKAFYEVLPTEYKDWDYTKEINNLVKKYENKYIMEALSKKDNISGSTSSDSGVSGSRPRELS